MSWPARRLSSGYRRLLRLYPASFRVEFATEVEEVLSEASPDAAHQGRGALVRLCLRDLGSWPVPLAREWASIFWAWRAWLSLATTAVLALVITRSLRPLAGLFTVAWNDCTRLSLALYGALPFVTWFAFDHVHAPYRLPFWAQSSLLLAAGAVAYMRSETIRRRVLSLVAGLTASWLVSTVALAAYWHGPRAPGHAPVH